MMMMMIMMMTFYCQGDDSINISIIFFNYFLRLFSSIIFFNYSLHTDSYCKDDHINYSINNIKYTINNNINNNINDNINNNIISGIGH